MSTCRVSLSLIGVTSSERQGNTKHTFSLFFLSFSSHSKGLYSGIWEDGYLCPFSFASSAERVFIQWSLFSFLEGQGYCAVFPINSGLKKKKTLLKHYTLPPFLVWMMKIFWKVWLALHLLFKAFHQNVTSYSMVSRRLWWCSAWTTLPAVSAWGLSLCLCTQCAPINIYATSKLQMNAHIVCLLI